MFVKGVILVALAGWALYNAGAAAVGNDCLRFNADFSSKPQIVVEGDSLTYGLDWNGVGRPVNGASEKRSRFPFPETLQSLLGNRFEVTNHGYPGDRSSDGLQRWSSSRTPSVTVVMYGTNDAGNHGKRASGPHSPEIFRQNLKKFQLED